MKFVLEFCLSFFSILIWFRFKVCNVFLGWCKLNEVIRIIYDEIMKIGKCIVLVSIKCMFLINFVKICNIDIEY